MTQVLFTDSDSGRDALYILQNNLKDDVYPSLAAIVAGSGVAVSANDTLIGYLNGKLVEGDAITLTVLDPSGDESLEIKVPDDGITYAKLQNIVDNNRILGRVSGADGAVEELTATQVKTILELPQSQYGLVPSWVSATEISFSAGQIFDSDKTDLLILPSALNKLINATWAEGSGLGGLFTHGTAPVAAATEYYFHLIKKDSVGTIDGGWDTDIDGTHIPTGWSKAKCIHFDQTESGSANLRAFRAYEKSNGAINVMWDDYQIDVSSFAINEDTKYEFQVAAPPYSKARLRLDLAYGVATPVYSRTFPTDMPTPSVTLATEAEISTQYGYDTPYLWAVLDDESKFAFIHHMPSHVNLGSVDNIIVIEYINERTY